jgi:hypothetical protein
MTQTIIKGALYFDGECILRPHFSGQFHTVDCTEYLTAEEIREKYSEETANEFLFNTPIVYRDIEYFCCECSPYQVGEWDLLSDISKIEFFDEETEF